jgi:hypothetical protein
MGLQLGTSDADAMMPKQENHDDDDDEDPN